jgi:hypothetical protein
VLDATIMDLRALLDISADPVKASEDLERMRLNLLKEVVDVDDTRRCILSMINEYNVAHGFTPARDGPSRAGQVCQRGRELGAELNQAAPLVKLPPIINKPTYSTPMKNLCATRYITSELDRLQGEDLREKQAQIQELLDAADLQQQAMEPCGEASGTQGENCIVVAGQNKSHGEASSPNHGPAEHSRSNRAPGRSGGTTIPSTLATTTGSPEIPPRLPESRVTLLGRTWWNWHAASLWRQPSRLRKLAKVLKVIIRLART